MMALISSSFSLTYNSQRIIQALKNELFNRQNEIGTGRKSDLSLILGPDMGRSLNKHALSGNLKTYLENNQTIKARLEITETSLSSIAGSAEEYKSSLILAQNDTRGQNLIVSQAENFLSLLISTLNSSFDNKYIFSGQKTNIAPLNIFFASPTSTAKSAIDNAFASNPPDGFGFSQTSSQVSSITPDQLDHFINGQLSTLFSETEWSTIWSNCSDKVLENKISPLQQLQTSITSNEAALRKIAMAYVMGCNLGAENMSAKTYQALARRTTEILDEGLGLLTSTRSRVGVMQQTIEKANNSLNKQSLILDVQIAGLEGIDQTEVAAKTNSLLGQIEASNLLTSRISKLSLVNFL